MKSVYEIEIELSIEIDNYCILKAFLNVNNSLQSTQCEDFLC